MRFQKICVAVATYRRPIMLRALLESLAALDSPDSAEFFVLVVDNDIGRSAEETVRRIASVVPVTIIYEVESRSGNPDCPQSCDFMCSRTPG